ncbi:MAG TPA: hypothetical protein VMW51_08695, partial [Terriglobia bacterium]|nr:hypothetical protein [Terriglobia bacterium]
VRKAGTNAPLLEVLAHYLGQAGVEPVADVQTAGGQPARCSEIAGYRKGEVRLLAVLPGVGCRDAGSVTLRFPASRYVYNLREHRLLGDLSTVKATLVEGAPLFLALSPEPIGKLSISAIGASDGNLRVRAGGAAAFRIQLTMPQGQSDFPEAVHLEVRDPAGKILSYYGGNLPLQDGAARFSIALALNDQPGQWQVTAQEPYTHQTSSAIFFVAR